VDFLCIDLIFRSRIGEIGYGSRESVGLCHDLGLLVLVWRGEDVSGERKRQGVVALPSQIKLKLAVIKISADKAISRLGIGSSKGNLPPENSNSPICTCDPDPTKIAESLSALQYYAHLSQTSNAAGSCGVLLLH
jgi:hypothetical protein